MCAHVTPRDVGNWTIEKIFEGKGRGIPPPELDLRNWIYGIALPQSQELDLRDITPHKRSNSNAAWKLPQGTSTVLRFGVLAQDWGRSLETSTGHLLLFWDKLFSRARAPLLFCSLSCTTGQAKAMTP